MKLNVVLLSVCAIFALSAQAFASSNFSGGYYPDHNCVMTMEKPVLPENVYEGQQLKDYNIAAKQYNDEMLIYTECINAYISNANNDLSTIERMAQKALNEARAL